MSRLLTLILFIAASSASAQTFEKTCLMNGTKSKLRLILEKDAQFDHKADTHTYKAALYDNMVANNLDGRHDETALPFTVIVKVSDEINDDNQLDGLCDQNAQGTMICPTVLILKAQVLFGGKSIGQKNLICTYLNGNYAKVEN